MNTFQKIAKYCAMAFAIFLAFSIIVGILGAASVFDFVFGSEGVVTEDLKNYEISQNLTDLYIDIEAADVNIRSGDKFLLSSNLENIKIEEKDGGLYISEKTSFKWGKISIASLNLTIPDNIEFEKADITTSAGRLTVDKLSAKKLSLELGAGEVEIGKLCASSKAEIDGGAGEITVKSGVLNNLDLDLGVGAINFSAQIHGNSEINQGVGETKLNLIGSKDDYELDFDKGLGSIKVEKEEMKDGETYGDGENKIDIDGGVGNIIVKFKENK